METLYSNRGKAHTVDIQYDYRKREYALYFDGDIYSYADTYAEALEDKQYLINVKKLSYDPIRSARA